MGPGFPTMACGVRRDNPQPRSCSCLVLVLCELTTEATKKARSSRRDLSVVALERNPNCKDQLGSPCCAAQMVQSRARLQSRWSTAARRAQTARQARDRRRTPAAVGTVHFTPASRRRRVLVQLRSRRAALNKRNEAPHPPCQLGISACRPRAHYSPRARPFKSPQHSGDTSWKPARTHGESPPRGSASLGGSSMASGSGRSAQDAGPQGRTDHGRWCLRARRERPLDGAAAHLRRHPAAEADWPQESRHSAAALPP